MADRMLAPVALINADSTVLYVNPAAAHAIGQEPGWLIGRRMLDLVHPEDRARVAAQLRQVAAGRPTGGTTTHRLRADASRPWRTLESTADNLLDNPGIAAILVSIRDVTNQLAQEQQLRDAAYSDPLTGLANRAWIDEELSSLMRDEVPLAVGFLGLDRFKLINDSLGHGAGDAVLGVAAARLRAALPASVRLGRFSGDVFVVLLSGAVATEARSVVWQTLDRLGEPLFLGGHELRLSASAGIAVKDDLSTEESLMRDAGLALHGAKVAGRGRVELFQSAMREAAVTRLEMEADLRRAIGSPELSLALQPVVHLEDRRACGAEALLRWNRAGVPVAPAQFIGVAEETGLILPLGDWVIDRAAELVTGVPGGRLAVNLSARQLASPGLSARIARTLRARKVVPGSLSFEITESLLMTEFEYVVKVLEEIRNLGCAVGLDDFGTGYSSLSYLRRLPIDFLKIDRSLVVAVEDPQGASILEAVVRMAAALGLGVIAEGVETEEQASALVQVGCNIGQGYLLGRPQEVPSPESTLSQ